MASYCFYERCKMGKRKSRTMVGRDLGRGGVAVEKQLTDLFTVVKDQELGTDAQCCSLCGTVHNSVSTQENEIKATQSGRERSQVMTVCS